MTKHDCTVANSQKTFELSFLFTKVITSATFRFVYISKFCIQNIVSKILHVIHRSEMAKNIITASDVQLASSRRLFNYYIDKKLINVYCCAILENHNMVNFLFILHYFTSYKILLDIIMKTKKVTIVVGAYCHVISTSKIISGNFHSCTHQTRAPRS